MTDAELIEYIHSKVETPYPPVSPEVVASTEASLGFELPPLLRELYLKVGNGGIGVQESDLIGLWGGHQYCELTLEEFYHEERKTNTPYPYLFNGEVHRFWPEKLLIAFIWPCNIFSCIYCGDPNYPVYVYDCNLIHYEIVNGESEPTSEPVPLIKHMASLREWFLARIEGADLFMQMYELSEEAVAERERMEQERTSS